MPGPAAQATTARGREWWRLAGLGGEVGDADPLGPARHDAGLDGRARVVDVHVDVPQVGASDDEQRVPQAVERRRQQADGIRTGVAEEVHDLVGGPVGRLPLRVQRVVTGQGGDGERPSRLAGIRGDGR